MATVDWPEFDRHLRPVVALGGIDESDLEPLFARWARSWMEDHRQCVLSEQSKDGTPIRPVTYRGSVAVAKKTRKGRKFGAAFGKFAGFGPFAVGLNNNLTNAEYKKLTGPALAPRGDDSRILTNALTDWGKTGSGEFQLVAYLDEVVDTSGNPFMTQQFESGRDYRGISPWGVDRIKKDLDAFVDIFLSN